MAEMGELEQPDSLRREQLGTKPVCHRFIAGVHCNREASAEREPNRNPTTVWHYSSTHTDLFGTTRLWNHDEPTRASKATAAARASNLSFPHTDFRSELCFNEKIIMRVVLLFLLFYQRLMERCFPFPLLLYLLLGSEELPSKPELVELLTV